jgi:hypothetical protein
MPNRWVIDIDNTLLRSECKSCPHCGRMTYELVAINRKLVKKVNERFLAGDIVILWTGRGWDTYDITREQLKKIGLSYHELVMGKPQGIIVDADAIRNLP